MYDHFATGFIASATVRSDSSAPETDLPLDRLLHRFASWVLRFFSTPIAYISHIMYFRKLPNTRSRIDKTTKYFRLLLLKCHHNFKKAIDKAKVQVYVAPSVSAVSVVCRAQVKENVDIRTACVRLPFINQRPGKSCDASCARHTSIS